jgi:hypothetical protein
MLFTVFGRSVYVAVVLHQSHVAVSASVIITYCDAVGQTLPGTVPQTPQTPVHELSVFLVLGVCNEA